MDFSSKKKKKTVKGLNSFVKHFGWWFRDIYGLFMHFMGLKSLCIALHCHPHDVVCTASWLDYSNVNQSMLCVFVC